MKIISLHMPKAGGTTFLKLLESKFENHIILDYNDFPLKTLPKRRNKKANKDYLKNAILFNWGLKFNKTDCIHGHFLPYKYGEMYGKKNIQFVTWLRDPLERLASHYYFWKRNYTKNLPPGDLQRRLVEENWSLERFCLSEEMQNTYAQFLWHFPITQFNFVGITEHYNQDLTYFAKEFLGLDSVNIPTENTNPNKPESYFKDIGLRKELETFHAKDYEIYNKALVMRKDRL